MQGLLVWAVVRCVRCIAQTADHEKGVWWWNPSKWPKNLSKRVGWFIVKWFFGCILVAFLSSGFNEATLTCPDFQPTGPHLVFARTGRSWWRSLQSAVVALLTGIISSRRPHWARLEAVARLRRPARSARVGRVGLSGWECK